MHCHQKQLSFTVAALLLVSILLLPAAMPASAEPAAELDLTARAAVLIEADTGRVLYAKNAEETLYPASLTKIMTLLLAMEEKGRETVGWDTVITASRRAWETRGSTMFLNIGQQATFREMIRGIAVISANDACVAVAEQLFGSEAAFVQRMNQRAAELGMDKTNFTNSHGLHHPDHVTTALDAARLAAYFIRTQPEAAAFQAEREYTFNNIRQFNRNPLLGNFPGADGTKTGSTPEAGSCLAATAVQDGMRLVSVVLNCPSEAARRQDSEMLLNYGFRNFERAIAAEEGEIFATTAVTRGTARTVALAAAAETAVVIPRGKAEQLVYTVESRENLPAPVEAGYAAGTLTVTLEGETLAVIELVTAETVERLGFIPSVWRSITDLLGSLWIKFSTKPGEPGE